MAAQDVKNYADENWNQYLESITELSKEQKNGNALVTSDRQMYNFDKITKKIYAKRSNGVPTSADALAFSKSIFNLSNSNRVLKRKSRRIRWTRKKLNAIRQMHFVMIIGIYSLKIKRLSP